MDVQNIVKNKLYRKFVDEGFEIGVILKAVIGFFEVSAGMLLAISGKIIVNNLILILTQQEISEDPKDIFANYLIKALKNLSGDMHMFAIIYLIFHGVLNIFLSIFLLKGKHWAYPVAIGLFSMFLIYQAYKCFYSHSLLLLALTIFDAFVILFIFLEYRKKYKKT